MSDALLQRNELGRSDTRGSLAGSAPIRRICRTRVTSRSRSPILMIDQTVCAQPAAEDTAGAHPVSSDE